MTKYSNSTIERETPYVLPVKEAAKLLHTSEWFIRKGVYNGTIKHMRSGNKIYIHIPALMNTLDLLCGADDNLKR